MSEHKSREQRILEGIALWAGFYRCHPHRWVKDFLHVDLYLFQKILLNLMNWFPAFVFIAARGIGKTFLSAVFCVFRCILYPGTKICIASGTVGQSVNVLEKITTELIPNSPELSREIKEGGIQIQNSKAMITFKNGSFIKVVTARDSARGNRATLLLVDEFRMIPEEIISTILKKFLTSRRMPPYLKLREFSHLQEPNKVLYLSTYLQPISKITGRTHGQWTHASSCLTTDALVVLRVVCHISCLYTRDISPRKI